ncbi:helix-turn-helix transcriptional regulator [Notoacmeibacter ruber]|uniref:HTH luxR-type domain-containing protein n=1 Tax=Notoacmeibacter ruber TaxID=2670375 RepID=A0A3L7JFP4_9HYPH|nr:autoinducer binding domain-containing protein [Notoacmeibacter ruber]RLQ89139.1 hypothetical protein D8780_13690 [Notoacmeibacter ruber]
MHDRKFASHEVLDFYESATDEITAAQTSYDLVKAAKSIVAFFGWKHFIILRLPEKGDDPLSVLTLLTNWPPELIRAYDSHSLTRSSPVFESLRKTTLPVVYDLDLDDENGPCERKRLARELFKSFGHHNGIYIPTVTPTGLRGAVGLAGRREEMTTGESAGLAYMCTQLFERIVRLDADVQKPIGNIPPLTGRELDCIRWTADGKTSAETAEILNTTANTVNHYLTSASNKLRTLNKTHTVAKALRLKLLD